jgi:rod shape-determining protein MreD
LVIQDRVSLLLAFAVGLVIDNLYGSILGLHALSYVLVTYFSVRLGLRMNAEGFFQQFSLLFVVLGVYMLLNLWIQGMTGNVAHGWAYWVSLLSSVVVWPMYHAVLGYFQAHRKAL